MEFNISEHIGDDGNFTEGFGQAAVSALGEGYEGSKVFEGITNPAGMIKAYADTKKAYGQKLEGVIKKPGEDASDEERAEYSKQLLAELGAPEKAEDYEFYRPEELPEGMVYDEEVEASFREMFFEMGVPADMANKFSQKFSEVQIARHNAAVEEGNRQFTEQASQLDKDWTGDKKVINNRVAFKAIMQFGTDDHKQILKEANINGNVTDHEAWRRLGFTPNQRRVWANIGNAMKSDTAITDEGSPNSGDSGKTGLSSVYDHPTSAVLTKK